MNARPLGALAPLAAAVTCVAIPLLVWAQPARRDAGAALRDAGVARPDAGPARRDAGATDATAGAPADAAVPPDAAASAVRTLSLATLAPIGSTWMRTLEAWNRDLRRRTGATLSLRIYPNGVQGDEGEVVRKVRSGRLDGGALTAVGLALIHRPVLVFQAPGLFADDAALDRTRDALAPELEAGFAQAGFALVGWGDAGTDRVFSDRAVRSPDDLARTRLFLWSDDLLSPTLYEELHVRGVPMGLPEVLTSLQTRTLDTVIAPPIAVASLQWAAHVTHMTDLRVATEVGALVFGRAQLDSLSPAQRDALRETARQYAGLLVRNVRREDDGAVAPMRARGLAVDAVTPAERARWEAAFARTRARLVGVLAEAPFLERVERLARP
ncbi:MAG: TRAP transporter substrate-binding protein DctP [Polyangiales bacterium]